MQFVETPLDINSMPLQSPFAVSGRLVQHPPSQLPIPHLKKKEAPYSRSEIEQDSTMATPPKPIYSSTLPLHQVFDSS
jgi:hypothetical protein